MKKRNVAFVCACAMALSMVTVPAYAIDYGNGGSTGGTAAPVVTPVDSGSTESTASTETTVKTREVTNAIASGEAVSVSGESISLGKNAVAAIAKADAPVTFVNSDTGVSITIDPATVEKVGKIDLGMAVEETDMGVKITPAMTGKFGLTLSVTIPKASIPASVDVNNAHLYYVSDEGKVEDLGALTANKDGSFTVELTHASSYIIGSASIEDISAGAGLDGTGDVLAD